MQTALVKTVLVVSVLSAGGCGTHSDRVAVSGSVTRDGVPLDEGIITLAPAHGSDGVNAGGSIENGKFKIRQADGPNKGRYTIAVTGVPSRDRTVRFQRFEVTWDFIDAENELHIDWTPSGALVRQVPRSSNGWRTAVAALAAVACAVVVSTIVFRSLSRRKAREGR
jgi:hypothetical protein